MLREDEQPRGDGGVPTEPFLCDLRRETLFLVVLSKCRLDRRDLRLDLDDHQRRCRGVPREKVDRTALTVDRIRDFGRDLPAFGDQQASELLAEAGMCSVDESIEVTSSPPNEEHELSVDAAEDATYGADRHALDPPALE